MALGNIDVNNGNPPVTHVKRGNPGFTSDFEHTFTGFKPDEIAPVAGIYRCLECGHEVVLGSKLN